MKQEIHNKDLMRRAVRHLLVTDDDVMNEAERIVGHTLQRENQGDHILLNEGREKETSDLSRLDSQRSGIYKEVD